MKTNWDPPGDWIRISVIDAHAAGEPLRVVLDGFPELPGETILAKRRFLKDHHDDLRRALMWEPRGHADMYGAIVTPPVTPDGDLGVLFTHNAGMSTMCGHGTIALTTVLLDTGLIDRPGRAPVVRLDAPAGRVTATARRRGGKTESVSFLNVPSFVYARDETVDVPGIGRVRYDIAFGGAFYAFVRAEDLDVGLTAESFNELVDKGMKVKRAVMAHREIAHPLEPDLGFLYGTIIVGAAHDPRHHSRNVCVFADGEVDRSPTGTGLSARAALHYAGGEIALGERFVVESILGTCFTGRAVEETAVGPYPAVVPEVAGSASIIGRGELFLDPDDPLKHGFIFR
ncbi:MAG TPA: proline racemase [Candidatus Aminicenantes bacterium]|nr:proline racemase family protein [Candidatus Aminicenantes bacterium]HDT13870.1 proline racemase [Candidatus Aminicenantes bacterium]